MKKFFTLIGAMLFLTALNAKNEPFQRTTMTNDNSHEMNVPQYNKPTDEELRAKLTTLQYEVTQHESTEPPFKNDYWDEHRAGIYVDRVSGEPLFSSLDKFDSGTGWPSFTKPLVPQHLVEKKDNRLFFSRTEIRSKFGDSHLGHVFNDGPEPTGMRYCMNSAALRFILLEQLVQEGYGEFLPLFSDEN